MKNDILKTISKNIAKLLKEKENFNPKDLSESSDISYSTLAPILRGERDFRITNLVALAEALDCTPNDLMAGLFTEIEIGQAKVKKTKTPRYLISFITTVELSHCQIYDAQTKHTERRILPFALSCTDPVITTLEKIRMSIISMLGKDVNFNEAFLYLSIIGCEHVFGYQKLLDVGTKEFAGFIMESDCTSMHNAVVSPRNGILIIINNGLVITYSNDDGKIIHKLQGYCFPVSDIGANFWLGCEAIKHTINVVEKMEPRSLLSDKILSRVNSDLELLATQVYDNPQSTYVECAKIIREFAHTHDKAREIITQGFNNIWDRVKKIDKLVSQELPVYLVGDLAHLYQEFVPTKRLVKINFEHLIDMQFAYATDILHKHIKTTA